jgi:hypothetical protein
MSTTGSYYALTLGAEGTGAPTFFSLTPTSDLTISQGGATMAPSSPSASMIIVSVYPETLQISAPAGDLAAGVTIITNAGTIAGRVEVSPPVTVATVVTLYGAGGAQLGQSIVDPGVGSGTFEFPVSGEGIPDAATARQVIEQKIGAGQPTY